MKEVDVNEVAAATGILSDEEFSSVIEFINVKLGGPRIHKVGAAAVLMLEHANMHAAAEALAVKLLGDPAVMYIVGLSFAKERL